MGAFGRVAGGLANDWAAVRDKRLQQQTEQQTTLLDQANMAQKIKSQLLSDQLAQTAQQSQSHKDDLTNQVLEKQLKLMGYDWDKGNYEKDKDGNRWYVIRSPQGDVRRFPAGEPLAEEERETAAKAAEDRQREADLAKQLAAKTKFENDMKRQNARDAAMLMRERMIVNRRVAGLTPQQKLQLMGPTQELQRIKSELEGVDKQLREGKNPTARTGILGTFSSKEMTDDQRADLVDQRKDLLDQRERVLNQIEMIGALSDTQPPAGATPPGAGPTVTKPTTPPPPPGAVPIAGPNG